jgi:hypothetical protein
LKSSKKKIDILFVLLDIGLLIENSSVFQSQIGDQLFYLKNKGFSVGIICAIKNKSTFYKVIGNDFLNNGIKIFEVQQRNLFINFFNFIFTNYRITKKFTICNYYARGIWGGLVIYISNKLFFNNISYVYDVRGDLEDELNSIRTPILKKSIYLFLEKLCIKKANNITTVTTPLKLVIQEKYDIKEDIEIVPCCLNCSQFDVTDDEIDQERKILNINENDFVFVYSGGLSYYQQIPAMLKIWSNFICDHNVKFILLTNDDPNTNPTTLPFLQLFGDRLIHMTVNRKRVPKILNVCDVAFLLRDARSLNKVASPVKFAEYISSGLNVISSPYLGDVHQQIISNNIGLLISPDFDENSIEDVKNYINNNKKCRNKEDRIRIKKVGNNLYNWNSYEKTFYKLYKK